MIDIPHAIDFKPRPNEDNTFDAAGVAGPVRILTGEESGALKRKLRSSPPPLDWGKGRAATSVAFLEIAGNDAIVGPIQDILGPNIMLWGASLIRRKPGQAHPWHTDIETSADEPGTVSVWLGLENTSRESSLMLIPGSHRYGLTVQERAGQAAVSRDDMTPDDILSWAREFDSSAEIVQYDMSDGEAVFFDGRLWHGSLNTKSEGIRTALLLQYATPERRMQIPDLSKLDFPFRLHDEPRPPCLMIRGVDTGRTNRIVAPPSESMSSDASWVRKLRLPLAEDESSGWQRYPIRRGRTRCMSSITCHASVLSSGKTPHPPHSHDEEELLIMLRGSADIVIVDAHEVAHTQTIVPGDFVYYSSRQVHTISNVSDDPAMYLMFKWRNELDSTRADKLQTGVYRHEVAKVSVDPTRQRDMHTSLVMQGPTNWLRKLQCHSTTLVPGGGYEPHTDNYDVALLMVSGEVETLGVRLEASDIAFYAAGEAHGIRNVGTTNASYLIFEFHAPRDGGSSVRRGQV